MGHDTNKKVIFVVPLQRLFERRVKTGWNGETKMTGWNEGNGVTQKINALDILDDIELAEP